MNPYFANIFQTFHYLKKKKLYIGDFFVSLKAVRNTCPWLILNIRESVTTILAIFRYRLPSAKASFTVTCESGHEFVLLELTQPTHSSLKVRFGSRSCQGFYTIWIEILCLNGKNITLDPY